MSINEALLGYQSIILIGSLAFNPFPPEITKKQNELCMIQVGFKDLGELMILNNSKETIIKNEKEYLNPSRKMKQSKDWDGSPRNFLLVLARIIIHFH